MISDHYREQMRALTPKLRTDLATSWSGTILWDVNMAEYCTFRTGGRADALLHVATRAELTGLMQWLAKNGVNWRVIGRGSNILVQSAGFRGVVIILGGEFAAVETLVADKRDDQRMIRVGAACSVARLLNWCIKNELSGLEFLVGIPGSIGGAVRMNAGAWGFEIGSLIEMVCCVDGQGEVHELAKDSLDFSYRSLKDNSGALDKAVIVGTDFLLRPGRRQAIIEACRDYIARRRDKQPAAAASAGSVFKNPPGLSAGLLIDKAGLKGLRRGSAMVSPKHANFIVNTGDASPDDVVALMKEVQERVFRHSGVLLEPEVHLL